MTADEPAAAITARAEAARKAVHAAAAIAAAIVVAAAPPPAARTALAAAAVLALGIDLARLRAPVLAASFQRTFGPMLRASEASRLTGATTLATGCALAALLMPPAIAAAGILYAGLGDAAGAIVGRRFGRRRISPGRTLEGSFACFAATLPIGLLVPGAGFAAALAAALAVTALEAAPLPVDDNLLIPVVGAAALWTGILLFH